MNMLSQINSSKYRHILSFGLATSATLGIMSTLPSKATAANLFNGGYNASNWTLTNTNANGSVDTSNAANGSVILTGGDNGSNLSGITDWTIPINPSRSGNISFNWSYFTLDTPGFDSAGYLLNGNYTPLAVKDGDHSTNPVSLNVNNGDTFGFRVQTSSNSDGAGVLTVYNPSPVPEPLTILGSLTAAGFGIVLKRKRYSVSRPSEVHR